ncbi:hypothetical protein MSAN_01912600 [Mycena sanguinolenta]|uniref:Uncharacterized protein n=1 Tax=Mycena sanguinolenta TaxID=230812 RepID=A0A8H6XPT7_9AGAR|nr:hypothetical protein MSAN_01912600 [Mycena sanguinolenta]
MAVRRGVYFPPRLRTLARPTRASAAERPDVPRPRTWAGLLFSPAAPDAAPAARRALDITAAHTHAPRACAPTLPPPHAHHPHSLDGSAHGALHRPDWPPRFESRDSTGVGDDDQLTPVFAHPHSGHPDSHGYGGANGHYTLPPFKFTVLQNQHRNNDQHGRMGRVSGGRRSVGVRVGG